MDTALRPAMPAQPGITDIGPEVGMNWRRRVLFAGAEAGVAIGAAALLVFSSRYIYVNPFSRIGQVSALSALQLRFFAYGVVALILIMLAYRFASRHVSDLVLRFACAGMSGMATAFVAGGTLVALRGTPWPLNGVTSDAGTLAGWASSIVHGGSGGDAIYPPAFLHALAIWADLFHGGNTSYALKDLQIMTVGLMGPAAYLAWRLLLKPIWALAIGVVSVIPLLDPYRPYPQIVLAAFIPVIVKFVQLMRRTDRMGKWEAPLYGVAMGLLLGGLFISYSGWFIWSAGGVFLALVLFLPWRTGRVRAFSYLGAAGLGFLLIAGFYVIRLLRGLGTEDNHFNFDSMTDPAYFVMWRSEPEGDPGLWPPPGEIGGVGLFTLLVFLGLGVALALGLRRSLVATVALCMASTWALRHWFSSQAYHTGTAQLWQRTSYELMYCSLIIFGFAGYLVVQRVREIWVASGMRERLADKTIMPQWRRSGASAIIGAFCALMLIFGSAGSSISDKYMPAKKDPDTFGYFAWQAHTTRMMNGKCPTYAKYSPEKKCWDKRHPWLDKKK